MATVLTVILNYRTADMTLRAAEAALAAMGGIDGAVTIVDNDSRDGSFEALTAAVQARGWSRVRVVQAGHNGGFGAGNNAGIRAGLPDGTHPDYVYILNSDAFPAPGALAPLIALLDGRPRAGFAGSFIHGEDGAPHVTAFRFPTVAGVFEGAARFGPVTRLLRRHVIAPPLPEVTTRVDWVAGASVLVRRAMLDAVGMFDEGFFLYFEETDLSRRAAVAGWETWYVPESAVLHIGSVSTGMKAWRRMPDYWFASRWRYFCKAGGRGHALAVTLSLIAGTVIARLRSVVQRRPRVDPPHFLRDLIRDTLHRVVRPLPVSPPVPVRSV